VTNAEYRNNKNKWISRAPRNWEKPPKITEEMAMNKLCGVSTHLKNTNWITSQCRDKNKRSLKPPPRIDAFQSDPLEPFSQPK